MEPVIQRWSDAPVARASLVVVPVVSHRLLELASQAMFGMSPLRWMRLARLNGALVDLAGRHSQSVRVTALRWGLRHPGRFVIDCLQLFDESPAQTIRIARAQMAVDPGRRHGRKERPAALAP